MSSASGRRFHHVGLRATEPQPNENFVTATSGTGTRGTFKFTTALGSGNRFYKIKL